MIRRRAFASIGLQLVAIASANAASPREALVLVVGANVRVASTTLQKRAEGIVESIDETTITVVTQKLGSQRIPWETVKRVDLQVGTRRPVFETVLLGGALGALLGLVVPLDDSCNAVAVSPPPEPGPYGGTPSCSRGEQVGTAAVGGAAFGLLGAFIGEPIPKWKRLQPPYQRPSAGPAVSLRLAPLRGGMGARLDVSF